MASNSIRQAGGLRPLLQGKTLSMIAIGALTLMAGCGETSSNNGGTDGGSAPALSGVLPPTGSPTGGTLVTLIGTGFDVPGTTTVKFAGIEATDVVVIDDSTITAITPAFTNDSEVDVVVRNQNGKGTLLSGYHYLSTAGILTDLNSDGIPDIAIAASKDGSGGSDAGSIFVFYGTGESSLSGDRMAGDADVTINGISEGDSLGTALVAGDLNGDGHTDLIVGAPKADNPVADAGQVYVFFGPLAQSVIVSANQADVILSGEGTVAGAWWGVQGDEFGSSLSLGDVNQDGILDLLAGSPGVDLNVGQSNEEADAGRAYLFHGGASLATGSATNADAVVSGVRAGDQLGTEVCVMDVNEDSRPDLLTAFDVFVSGPTHSGRVACFTTAGQVEATSDDAEVVLRSNENGDRFGASVVCGDINGDGQPDLLVGAPFSNGFSSSSGRVYLFLGGTSIVSSIAQDSVDAIYSGQLTNTGFGSEVASADVNGDGFDDVMVGAPFTTASATWDGQVFVFFGGELPADSLAYNSDTILSGEPITGERFGSAIEVLDSNLDGIADIMSSATGHADLSGRVYVFNGEEALFDEGAELDDMTLTGESEGASFGSSISRGK
jgi:hypothetical protein